MTRCECSGCRGCSHAVPADLPVGYCDRQNTAPRWHTAHDNAFPLCAECYEVRKGHDVEDDGREAQPR